jgi:hypothetical protein
MKKLSMPVFAFGVTCLILFVMLMGVAAWHVVAQKSPMIDPLEWWNRTASEEAGIPPIPR